MQEIVVVGPLIAQASVACRTLGPGDFEAVPDFVREYPPESTQ